LTKSNVLIGMVGSALDQGETADRWERWRPTVDLFRHDDFLVARFELLHLPREAALAARVASDIRAVSPETVVQLREIALGDPWDFEQVYGALHDFARACAFTPDREDYLVHVTTGTHVVQICLFLLTESRHIPARLVQSAPPRRRGGVGRLAIIDLDLSKYDRLASRFAREQREGLSSLKSGIDTRNEAFNRLMEQIERVALSSDAPILLTGPTGAGKSRLARRIYELKRSRRLVSGELVELNCATLRGDAAMSALFGHRRGAFTGAQQDRPGLLRAADKGLLFLDEVGELGPDEQAMLLRALEEKTFLPLGADREVRSDFQLIAGTNRDLGRAVADGRFRDDLLSRINLWSFDLPGLAARREDLEPNIDYELARFGARTGRQVRFNASARTDFLAFAMAPSARWPGNFRDLNASIVRMATLADGGRITERVADAEIERLETAWRPAREVDAAGPGSADDDELLNRAIGPVRLAALDRFDRVQLIDVLRVCASSASLSEAGRELFSASRQRRTTTNDADRLRKYLARFGVDPHLLWRRISSAASR
jgi:transcriptional regulatory protein RtcR